MMIFAVSSAAAPLRSTQNTCAPSRAKVTAVALPLPQPGPIEPAPTTIATLPLSRSIARLPFCCSCSPDGAKRNPGSLFPDFASLHPGYGSRRCGAARRTYLRFKPSLERHVQALGDVGAEAGGDGDAAADLLRGHVG